MSLKLTNPSPEVGLGTNPTNQSSLPDKPDIPSSTRKFSLADIILVAWFIGVLGLSGYIFLWQRQFLSDITGEAKTAETNIMTLYNRCRELMGIKQPVPVFMSSKLLSPTLLGFVCPRLLLSEETSNFLSEE